MAHGHPIPLALNFFAITCGASGPAGLLVFGQSRLGTTLVLLPFRRSGVAAYHCLTSKSQVSGHSHPYYPSSFCLLPTFCLLVGGTEQHCRPCHRCLTANKQQHALRQRYGDWRCSQQDAPTPMTTPVRLADCCPTYDGALETIHVQLPLAVPSHLLK